MIVWTYLNNYQMGSYSHSVLSNKIIKEERISPLSTKVTWDVDEGDKRLLQKAIGNKMLFTK